MSVLLRVAVCVPLLAVAGCATLKEPAGVTYAKSLEQMGITAVYPPREDLQVGDVYAIAAHSFADRLTAGTAYIGRKDMTRQVRDYLGSRYKFASTQVEAASASKPEAVERGQKDARSGTTVTGRSDLQTLPIDGLPQIEVNSGISIGVGGQPKGLAVSFGLEATKTLKMSLQFGGVSSYEVSVPEGVDALDEFCRTDDPDACYNDNLSMWLNQKYQVGPGDPGYVTAAGALMVTKVYLARQIVYTFNDATLAAAAAAAVGDDGTQGTAPTISPADVHTAVASDNPDMVTAMANLITALNTSVKQNGAGQGSFSVAAVNENSVSIREIFDRPVVIGYEGVSTIGWKR